LKERNGLDGMPSAHDDENGRAALAFVESKPSAPPAHGGMFFLTEQSQFLLETKRLLTEQSQFWREQSEFWPEQNGLGACGPGRVLILAGTRGCTTNFQENETGWTACRPPMDDEMGELRSPLWSRNRRPHRPMAVCFF